ncbi:MAG: prolyl oligopeptidase family serine peptidase [Pirellulales bacterium]|nr:prolyl oligopeptidase family serine peptidase [Pirellulales bacterium]
MSFIKTCFPAVDKKTLRWTISPALLAILLFSAEANAFNPAYFTVGGHQAFILSPTGGGDSIPWVWYAPTIVGHNPNSSNDWLFQQLLDNGIAVAGIDIGESYGNPAGRTAYSEFYTYATTEANLAPQAMLLAQSRGGLMLYNWAAENADKVSAIAGIYPVGDLRSYPGLATAAPAYGMTVEQLEQNLSDHNPIDRLLPLAQADVPIFHIHGDNDTSVPLDENSQVVYDRYTAMGGDMQLVVVPGKGHEEIPEYFQSLDLLNFALSNVYQTPEPSTFVLLAMGAALGLLGLLARALRKR